MRIARTASICLALGLLLTAFPAGAQGLNPFSGGGNIGAHLGYLKGVDSEDGNLMVGGHLEILLTQFLGIRGDVSYHSEEEYRFMAEGQDLSLEVRTIPVTVSARVYLPLPVGIKPFGSAGVGWYRMEYEFSEDALDLFDVEDDTETTFGWHLGAGLVLPLAPRIGLYGEYRAIFTDPDRDLGDEVQEAIGELDFDASNLIVGLSLYF
jgi:opacity protein-like surface antigen